MIGLCPPVGAAQDSDFPPVPVLTAEVNALQSAVATLQAQASTLQGAALCVCQPPDGNASLIHHPKWNLR